MDLPARAWPHLFLGIFLAGIPNPRLDRSQRDSSGGRVLASCRSRDGSFAHLVCAHVALVFEHFANACFPLLGRDGGVSSCCAQPVAARYTCAVLRFFSFFRVRRARFFWISIRRHVARSRIYLAFLRAARFSAWTRAAGPPSRISLFVLQWEWFRIYFESGVAKIASGDIQWRHLTAMDEYYQRPAAHLRLGPDRLGVADSSRELAAFARAGFARRVAEAVLAGADIAAIEALARGGDG